MARMGFNMNIATFWAGAKVKIAIALAGLIALAVALWEAYSKGRSGVVKEAQADEAKDLRNTLDVTTSVNDLIHDRPPNIAVNDPNPTAVRVTVPSNIPVVPDAPAVKLQDADPDSSAGRLNILAENNP